MRISDWSSDVCSSDLVKGYILPQFDGWMKNGALTGYEMYMNRYPVGTPWDVLFIQHYRDMESFGRRQRVTEETRAGLRSEEHTSELQSLMRISYAGFCLKKQNIEAQRQTPFNKS